jgi:hypothetical protein
MRMDLVVAYSDPHSSVVCAMQPGQLQRICAIRKRQFEASQQLSVLMKEIERFEQLGFLKLQEQKKLKLEIRGLRKEALQTMDYTKEQHSPVAVGRGLAEHVQSCSASTSRPRPSSCCPSSSSPRPGFYVNFDP